MIEQRGYPLSFSCPDPRAFALHKLWLSRHCDRDAVIQSRDAKQARVVAELIGARLPHLRYDCDDLRALPLSLRQLTAELNASNETGEPNLTPNW